MESREMVLMSLFAGQEQRHRCGERTCGHSMGSEEWDALREQHRHVYSAVLCRAESCQSCPTQ